MPSKEFTKPKVLFLMHLPPPVHGAAMAGNYIKTSSIINEEIDTEYINLATNVILSESGRGSFRKLVTFVSIVKQLFITINRNSYDICHISLTASGLGFYKDLLMVAILKLHRIKLIYHFHNKGVAKFSRFWINRIFYRFVFTNTQSILLSPHLYTDIGSYVKKTDVYYCPYGIPPLLPSEEQKKEISDPSKPCQLLYLSNMMTQKGVYVLLDALEKLKDKQLSFECHFVGGWADITEELFKHKLDEKNLSEVVFAHGPKYGQEKFSHFNKAEVFLFPTFYHFETFGIVNLEAMQHGLAIISTPEGGIPDIVVDGETGFLVPQQNSEELAKKLEIFIHQPDLRLKMGLAGKERFRHLFTIDKFEKKLVDILKIASGKQKQNSITGIHMEKMENRY